MSLIIPISLIWQAYIFNTTKIFVNTHKIHILWGFALVESECDISVLSSPIPCAYPAASVYINTDIPRHFWHFKLLKLILIIKVYVCVYNLDSMDIWSHMCVSHIKKSLIIYATARNLAVVLDNQLCCTANITAVAPSCWTQVKVAQQSPNSSPFLHRCGMGCRCQDRRAAHQLPQKIRLTWTLHSLPPYPQPPLLLPYSAKMLLYLTRFTTYQYFLITPPRGN